MKDNIVVINQGYNETTWFKQLTEKGIFNSSFLMNEQRYFRLHGLKLMQNIELSTIEKSKKNRGGPLPDKPHSAQQPVLL